ncbi:hypothetical protein XHC_1667 [Xanthomonas hortorum pv. carotae str. M081]|nr:hypothetical protein XHC_1667 [Xanthomonas hortorum pv. carotae str. M081]
MIAPTIGGALLYRLWISRPTHTAYIGLAVGQIPQRLRRRTHMAVRREAAHG